MEQGPPGLLGVPLVIQGSILSLLTIKEQLSLRQVSRETKAWIDRASSTISRNITATLLSANERPFTSFLNRNQNAPSTHLITTLHVENENVGIYNDIEMPRFLSLHAHFITALQLKRYYVCGGNENQHRFLQALTNLKSLEVDELWIASSGNTEASTQIPEGFGTLAILKMGHTIVYNESTGEVLTTFSEDNDDLYHLRWFPWYMIEACPQLKYLRVPVSPQGLFEDPSRECVRLLHYMVHIAQSREIVWRAGGTNDRWFQCDLNGFKSDAASLQNLLIWHSQSHLQFLNVDSKLFTTGSSFYNNSPRLNFRDGYVGSLLYTYRVDQGMPHVRKMVIQGSLLHINSIGRNNALDVFPNLEEISIILDVGLLVSGANLNVEENNGELEQVPSCIARADNVLLYLFPEGGTYPRCQSLSITFLDPVERNQRRASPGRLSSLPRIIACLPALRNLHIAGWNGTRTSYLQLWQGFPQLEKLKIERCRSLNAACFIGGNGHPNRSENFQFFSELRFVEFVGLESMSKMTSSRGLGMSVLSKFGFEPFGLRTTNVEDRPRNAVWVRLTTTTRPVVTSQATMTTRSASQN